MFRTLTLRTRLLATMGLLGAIILVFGLVGISSMRSMSTSIHDLYVNELEAMLSINDAKNFLSRARFTLDRAALHPDQADVQATLARAEKFVTESNAAWQKYMSLPHYGAEKSLAEAANSTRDAYINDGMLALGRAIRAHDVAAVDNLAMKVMSAKYAAYNDAALKLDDYQIQQGKKQYEDSMSLNDRVIEGAVIGIVVGAILILVSSISLLRAIMKPLEQANRCFEAMARGDLSSRIEIHRGDEMGKLLEGLARMQDRLASTVRSVRDGSSLIANATSEIAAGNLNLSSRTEQQAGSLEETSSSLEELTATVRQNADNARQANQLAVDASEVAVRGGKIVSEVVQTMGSINDSSKRIVDIISVIDGIAFQTNILALNAAVEAARAGEQGRGFAVVAGEVRNLAHRSAAAAKEIKELITTSVSNISAGSDLVTHAGSTMDEVVTSVARVASIMAEIMVASQEQNAGIQLINGAVVQMDMMTQENAALVEEAAAAAASLQNQAESLAHIVESFRVDAQDVKASGPRGRVPVAQLLA